MHAGSFSPDNGSVVFAQLRAGEHFLTSLFVMGVGASGLREIAEPDAGSDPDWGPAATTDASAA